MNALKLFVVGESSGNPMDWNEVSNRVLVYAVSESEALALTDYPVGMEVSEVIPPYTACVVCYVDNGPRY